MSSLYAFASNLGGVLGVSAFGLVFDRRLTAELGDVLPKNVEPSTVSESPEATHQLAPQLQQEVIRALVDVFHNVFLLGVALFGVALLVSLALPDLDLKEETGAEQRAGGQ